MVIEAPPASASQQGSEGNAQAPPPSARVTKTEFQRNLFIDTALTSGAESGRKEGEGSEAERKSELVSFRDSTIGELATFTDNWAVNYAHALAESGGRGILSGDVASMDLFEEVLGGKIESRYDSDEVRRNIRQMLESPKGIMRSMVGLEEATADGLFVLGLASTAELAKQDIDPMTILDDFKADDDAEVGAVRRFGRRVRRRIGRTHAAQWAKDHPKTTGTAAGTAAGQMVGQIAEGAAIHHDVAEAVKFLYHHMNDIPHTPASLTTYAGGAAGLAIGWYLERRGQEKDTGAYQASKAALEAIQKDQEHAARIKALWGVDVYDFSFDDDTGSIKVREHPESTANLKTVLEGVTSNLETRAHVLEDLGVPKSDRDLMPELFILQNEPTQYERTGLRVHQDIMKKYHQLGGEHLHVPDQPEVDDAEKQSRLVTDLSGRDRRDPLWGRGYPEDVRIPRYDIGNVLTEHLDIWGQADLKPDPTRPDSLRRRESQFYGRTSEDSIYLLDSEDIRLVDRTDVVTDGDEEKVFQNGELAERRFGDRFRRSSRPDAVIRPKMLKDSRGQDTAQLETREGRTPGTYEAIYQYEVRNSGKEIPVPLDRIFYIDANGNRQQLASVRDFNPSDGTFRYKGGVDESSVMANSFFIPTDGSAPLPLSMLDHVATKNSETGAWVDINSYVCREGASATVDIDERVFTGVDKNGRTERLPRIVYEDTNLEDFYRDNALQTPLGEDAQLYGRVRERYLADNLQKLFPPGTKIGGVSGRASLEEIIDAVQDGRVVLRGELRLEDIEDYFQGKEIPPRAKELLDDAFPRKDVILGPLMPLSKEAFKARDSAGRSPADIRFGITDEDILTALDGLPSADLANFDSATGLDIWGQGPGDSLFCRANREDIIVTREPGGVTEHVNLNDPAHFDLDSIVVDQWGQERMKDGKPNPFFMRQEEGEIPESQMDVTRYRKAREFVLANLTEDIIEQRRQFPKRDISGLDEKISERDEGGRVREERKKKATEDLEQLGNTATEFDRRVTRITAYDVARTQLIADTKRFEDLAQERFGTIPADAAARERLLRQIGDFARGHGALEIRIDLDGELSSLESISSRRADARRERDSKYTGSYTAMPEVIGHDTTTRQPLYAQPIAEYRKALRDEAEREFQGIINDLEEERKMALQIKAELEGLSKPIVDAEAKLEPNGDLGRERHRTIFLRPDSLVTVWQLTDNDEVRDLLLTGTPEAIMKKINELHTADANFGWSAEENDDIPRQEILLYAMTTEMATRNDGDTILEFRNNPALQTMLDNDISYEQIENLPESELLRLLTEQSVTTFQRGLDGGGTEDVEFDEENVRDVKKILRDYVRNMSQSTQLLKEDFGLRSNRLTTRGEKDELSETEQKQLKLIKECVNPERQDVIFGTTALFVSGVDTFLQVDETKSRTFGDLEDIEKSEFPESDATGADTPLGYYEIMDILFDYRRRPDRNVYFKEISAFLPPDRLHEILKRAASEANLPVEIQAGADLGEFLYSLHDNIKNKKLVTRRALRQMFVGVIDDLISRGRAMD